MIKASVQDALSARSACATSPGRVRELNEDRCLIVDPAPGDYRRKRGSLYLLADGMGGAQAGEVAAEMTVTSVAENYYSQESVSAAAALLRSIEFANQLIHDLAGKDASRLGMGAALVAAAVQDGALTVAHVGDSRAYLLRQGSWVLRTRDQSLVEARVQAGVITDEEARCDPQRNIILQALGTRESVSPAIQSLSLAPGDRLMLCSDGVHGELPEEAIARILAAAGDPRQAAHSLLAAANEAGGRDNLTTLVVEIGACHRARVRPAWLAAMAGIAVVVLAGALVTLQAAGVAVLPGRAAPTWTAPAVAPQNSFAESLPPTATIIAAQPTTTAVSAQPTVTAVSVRPREDAAPPAGQAAPPSPRPARGVITADDVVRVRSAPLLSNDAQGRCLNCICILRPETEVEILSTPAELGTSWYKIALPADQCGPGPAGGYVFADLLSVLP